MQSTWAKAGIGVAALVAAIVLFVVLGGGGESGEGDGGGEGDGQQVATTEESTRDLSEADPGGAEEESGGAAEQSGETGEDGGGGTEQPSEPKDPTIVVEGGEPVDGIAELDYSKGDRARFRVRSDVADEVHVHGYDIIKEVQAGGSVSFDFPAEIDGLFEVELEAAQVQIAQLRVEP